MNIEKILSLVGADKLSPEIKGQITELLELLIADPKYTPALEKLLTLIGADRLDAPTQKTIKENLMSVIDAAAKELLNEIGPMKAVELKQVRRTKFEKQVISRLYCGVDKNKKPLIENSDQDIKKVAEQNLKVAKIARSNW